MSTYPMLIPVNSLRITSTEGQKKPKRFEDEGRPGYLSKEQVEALNTLRGNKEEAAVNPLFLDDGVLLRYLRARNFNPAKALELLKQHREWRNDFPEGKPYAISDFPVPFRFHLDHFAKLSGFDKEGYPIIVLRPRAGFPKEIEDSTEVAWFFVAYMDSLSRYAQENGKYEFTLIFDLSGYSIRNNFSISLTRLMLAILQEQYPETLYRAFVLNTPFGFQTVWNFLAPLLEDRVKSKMSVVKPEDLLEFIDADQLEVSLGGTHAVYPVPDLIIARAMEGIAKDAPIFIPSTGSHFSLRRLSLSGSSPTAAAAASSAAAGGSGSSSGNSKPEKKKSKTPFKRKAIRKAIQKWTSSALKTVRSTTQGPFKFSTEEQAQNASTSTSSEEGSKRKRVVVFGASGKLGRLIITEALRMDYDVTAFLRADSTTSATSISQITKLVSGQEKSRIVIVRGDIMSPYDLDRTLEDAQAVVFAISVTPSLTSLSEAYTQIMPGVIEACNRASISRLCAVSVIPSYNMSDFFYRVTHFKYIEQMDKMVQESGLNFTVIRTPPLVEGGDSGEFSFIREKGSFLVVPNDANLTESQKRINREFLAIFIVHECLNKSTYEGQVVSITNDR